MTDKPASDLVNEDYAYIQYDDPKATLGVMCTLAISSRLYARASLGVFIENCLHPIDRNQYIIQLFRGTAVGFLTFAKVNKVTENLLTASIRQIYASEWDNGDVIMIQDMVTTFGDGQQLINYLRKEHPESEIKGVLASKPTGDPSAPYRTANFHKGDKA